MQTHNAVNWFEIPVADLARAGRFYSAVLDKALNKQSMGPHEMLVFPYQEPGVGGCLISYQPLQPGTSGALMYLAVSGTLKAALTRVAQAGGSVAQDRTELPGDMGCYAHIIDTEGNRVGLHAAN